MVTDILRFDHPTTPGPRLVFPAPDCIDNGLVNFGDSGTANKCGHSAILVYLTFKYGRPSIVFVGTRLEGPFVKTTADANHFCVSC